MKINKEILDSLISFDEHDYFKSFVDDEWFLGYDLDQAIFGYIGEFGIDEHIEAFILKCVSRFGSENMMYSVIYFLSQIEMSRINGK